MHSLNVLFCVLASAQFKTALKRMVSLCWSSYYAEWKHEKFIINSLCCLILRLHSTLVAAAHYKSRLEFQRWCFENIFGVWRPPVRRSLQINLHRFDRVFDSLPISTREWKSNETKLNANLIQFPSNRISSSFDFDSIDTIKIYSAIWTSCRTELLN